MPTSKDNELNIFKLLDISLRSLIYDSFFTFYGHSIVDLGYNHLTFYLVIMSDYLVVDLGYYVKSFILILVIMSDHIIVDFGYYVKSFILILVIMSDHIIFDFGY